MKSAVLALFFLCCSCRAAIIDNPVGSYDYIIVGGGTSGAVLANRLSKDQNIRVLVLEGGSVPHEMAEMPFYAPMLQLAELDWGYKTVPQKHACQGLKGKRSLWPRGKALGGCSVINYMMYVRGTRKDYDNWEKNGATGWGWNDVLPYFMRSEDNKDMPMMYNGYHGTGGEMSVQRTNYYTPLAKAYVEAAKQLNYSEGDFNAAHPNRFMVIQGHINNGARWSTYNAFIEPVRKRRNLDIVVGAYVTKILFNENKRAIGVQFDHRNRTKTVSAKQEVLLSAGAISSPHILMLSGVGPRRHLEEFGIPVVADLPVGKNLQDHAVTGVPFEVTPQVTLQLFRTMLLGVLSFYVRKGPLTSMGVEVAGFFSTKYNNDPDWPDIELMFASYSPSSDDGTVVRYMHGMSDELWNTVFQPYVGKETFFCMPLLMRPLSKGEITLASTNPYDSPLIDPKYFSVPHDLKVITEGVKKCFEFARTPALRAFEARPFNVTFPGCEQYRKDTDDYYSCMVQVYTLTNYHPVGTCKMGDPQDPTTVVDTSLRVKGVSRLRVVDASIIPFIVTGHTESPAMMVGEKAADLILNDYYREHSPDIDIV